MKKINVIFKENFKIMNNTIFKKGDNIVLQSKKNDNQYSDEFSGEFIPQEDYFYIDEKTNQKLQISDDYFDIVYDEKNLQRKKL